MADSSFLEKLQTKPLHLLLVVIGVLAIFGVMKGLAPQTEIRMSALDAVEAGSEVAVDLQAEPNSKLELRLQVVNDLENVYEVEMDADGRAHFAFPDEELDRAGSYILSAAYLNSEASTSQNFEVFAAEADLSRSRVSFSSSVLEPEQNSIMSVVLADAYGNPVVGHSLSVLPNTSAVEVFTSEFVTNEKGQMNFTVLGNGSGIAELSLFDSTLGKTILAPSQVALRGGSPLNDSVLLAESGPVDSFVINGLDQESQASEDLSVTVKAIDADGFTVTDYTGTIRFSSSDDQASLPNDYTFLAEDQGEHSFTLGIKFVTLGEQTLSVTDLDDVRINGDESTSVVSGDTSSPSYNSDFETTDFAREGDFELISPASGSYSSNTVEIQGEAEYGNTAFILLNGEEAGQADIEFDNSFAYTLQDLSDGTYELYVEIRDDQDIVLETSSVETLTIDTSAPEIVSISLDPSSSVEPGTSVEITVLSEANLDEVAILLNSEVFVMEETSSSGKYQASLVAPNEIGEYSVDVLLVDALGNEVQARDQATLTVGTMDAPSSEPDFTDTTEVQSSVGTVSNVTATGSAGGVALSWETPESALPIAYYRLYYGPSPSALFATVETTDAATHWTVEGLVPGELYYFAVTAVDNEGTESEAGEAVLGIPEEDGSTPSMPLVPAYPVSNDLDSEVSETPETGPATTGLVILSSFSALAYVLLRRRARC